MENKIDYDEMIKEAKKLKLLNDSIFNEIVEKQDQMEKSIKLISRKKVKKSEKNETCKYCGK